MPVRPPRRIFRRSLGARLASAALPAFGLAIAAGGACLAPWPGLAPPPAPMPEALSAGAGDVTVVDGDTLRLHGRVVRLFGIAAPERGAVCPAAGLRALDCAAAAADALATLVRAERVDCAAGGTDAMGRAIARCVAGGNDLSRALVKGGWVYVVRPTPDLSPLETEARQAHRGYWALAATRSW